VSWWLADPRIWRRWREMTKADIVEFISSIKDDADERIHIVYKDDDDAEDGDVLEIVERGYNPRLGHVLYVGRIS
jgi:hypothetical protein